MDQYRRKLLSVGLDLIVAKWPNGEFHATNSVLYIPDELNLGKTTKSLPPICLTTAKSKNGILAEKTTLNEHGLLVASFGQNQQLAKLHLEPGRNAAILRIILDEKEEAQQQQKQQEMPLEIDMNIFLWDVNDKVIISDIDGTITRSDKRGLLLPMFGIKWAQKGVVELYLELAKRGYKLAYLSSRPIPLLNETREYLHEVLKLPDGPIFLTPQGIKETLSNLDSVLKPVPFKKNAVQQIKDIFPSQIEPFCLGIGNQVTDTEVYQAFNLPQIFIVDEQGSIVVHQNGTNGKKMMKTSNYIEIRENIEQWLSAKMQ